MTKLKYTIGETKINLKGKESINQSTEIQNNNQAIDFNMIWEDEGKIFASFISFLKTELIEF